MLEIAAFMPYWPYLAVFLFAVIEGEIAYAGAAALAKMGHLEWSAVLLLGALGAWAGDQMYFYAFRTRAGRWLDRIRPLARRKDLIVGRVRRHANPIILASRFLPGFRIAIPAACAYANVSRLRFGALNLVSAMAWAGLIMGLIAVVGVSAERASVPAWWILAASLGVVVLFSRWLSCSARSLAGANLH